MLAPKWIFSLFSHLTIYILFYKMFNNAKTGAAPLNLVNIVAHHTKSVVNSTPGYQFYFNTSYLYSGDQYSPNIYYQHEPEKYYIFPILAFLLMKSLDVL
jgi:hypothetical protein